MATSRPEVILLEYNEKDEISGFTTRTFGDMGTWMTNATKAFNVWKASPYRREVRDYQFELNPENCDPKKFNLFTGKLPMSHIEPHERPTAEELVYLQPILQHILVHFCGGEDDLADYLLNWLAFPLQRLGEKTGVAVVVKGLPGTGKGLIFNRLVAAIYGEHYAQCKDIQDLVGNFNAATAKKMFVNLDEATMPLFRENLPKTRDIFYKYLMSRDLKERAHVSTDTS